MKMRFLTTICALAMAISGVAQAQSPVDMITVHFSTPVMAAGTTLPAGECTIQVLRGSSDNVVLVIRSKSGVTANVLVKRISDPLADTDGRTSVVLTRSSTARNDSGYQLDRILLPDHTGFQVMQ
jgi:hypothetical protein